MGTILSCSCNNQIENNNNQSDFPVKSIDGTYNLNQMSISEDFNFSRSKAKIYKNIPNETLIENISILNLIRKIQKNVRFFFKIKQNSNKNKFGNSLGLTAYNVRTDKSKFNQTNEDISLFIGNKMNGLKEGFGLQSWKDGADFKGIFKKNQANGIGKFIHSDGDYYCGDFISDKASGFGIYLHTNGAKYIGEWHDDLQEGTGIEMWKDGSHYNGFYHNGKKNGIGRYYWSDGATFEGEWIDNCLNGFGVYYFTDHRTYIGEWKNNMMHGYGEFSWKDGKKYIGYYSNDKKEGFGIYYWQDPNKAYIGYWTNGKQDGVGKYITSNKTKYGLWSKGEKLQWFNSEHEALSYLNVDQEQYAYIFKYDLNEISKFLNF